MESTDARLKVRQATPEDAEALATLANAFNGTAVTAADVQVRLAVSRRHELVYLAVDNEQPAGFVCAQVYDSICYIRPMAEVTELFVSDSHRRRGVGRALLAQVETDLAARQVNEIRIETHATNVSARKLYLASGYNVTEQQVLVKKLK